MLLPLDPIESDMWRWNILSVSISIPFIVIFLTYNYLQKIKLGIPRDLTWVNKTYKVKQKYIASIDLGPEKG